MNLIIFLLSEEKKTESQRNENKKLKKLRLENGSLLNFDYAAGNLD